MFSMSWRDRGRGLKAGSWCRTKPLDKNQDCFGQKHCPKNDVQDGEGEKMGQHFLVVFAEFLKVKKKVQREKEMGVDLVEERCI